MVSRPLSNLPHGTTVHNTQQQQYSVFLVFDHLQHTSMDFEMSQLFRHTCIKFLCTNPSARQLCPLYILPAKIYMGPIIWASLAFWEPLAERWFVECRFGPRCLFFSLACFLRCCLGVADPSADSAVRPISLLRLSLPRFVDSNFPGNSLWTWEFYPLIFRFWLSQTLWNPES